MIASFSELQWAQWQADARRHGHPIRDADAHVMTGREVLDTLPVYARDDVFRYFSRLPLAVGTGDGDLWLIYRMVSMLGMYIISNNNNNISIYINNYYL